MTSVGDVSASADAVLAEASAEGGAFADGEETPEEKERERPDWDGLAVSRPSRTEPRASSAPAAALPALRRPGDTGISMTDLSLTNGEDDRNSGADGQRGVEGEPADATHEGGAAQISWAATSISQASGSSWVATLAGYAQRSAAELASRLCWRERVVLTSVDLANSWGFAILQLVHAWAFFLASVILAVIAITTFLDNFISLQEAVTGQGRTLQQSDWFAVMSMTVTTLAQILLFTGLIERAFWLLLDCLRVDMFRDYRRMWLECCYHFKLCGKASAWSIKWDMLLQVFIYLSLDFAPPLVGYRAKERRTLTSGIGDVVALYAVGAGVHIVIFYIVSTIVDFCVKVTSMRDLINKVLEARRAKRASRAAPPPGGGGRRARRTTLLNALANWSTNMVDEDDEFHPDQLGITDTECSPRHGAHDEANVCIPLCNFWRGLFRCHPGVILATLYLSLSFTAFYLLEQKDQEGRRSLRHVWWNLSIPTLSALTMAVILYYLSGSNHNRQRAKRGLPPNVVDIACARWFRANCGVTPARISVKACFGAILSMFAGALANPALENWLSELHLLFICLVGLVCGGLLQQFLSRFLLGRRLTRGGTIVFVLGGILCAMLISQQMGFSFRFRQLLKVGSVCVCVWCLLLLACTRWDEHRLWQLILGQHFLFLLLAIVTKQNFFLIMFTQLGMAKEHKGKFANALSWTLILVAMMIALFTIVASTSSTGLNFTDILGFTGYTFCEDPSTAKGRACTNFTFPFDGSRPRYSFCGMAWPMGANISDPNGGLATVSEHCEDTELSLADFGQFASMAYFLPSVEQLKVAAGEYLPGWTVNYTQSYDVTQRTHTTFAHLSRGLTSVIAIRGTASASEMLQDLNLWLPAIFLELANIVSPVHFDLRTVLEYAQSVTGTFRRRGQFKDVLDYTRKVVLNARQTGEKVYVTGHSLGGGLATVLGAVLSVPAVTFSAPGLKVSSVILDPEPDLLEMRQTNINIKPFGDPIPEVDQQAGSLLKIGCSMLGIKCHSLQATLCEILASCGDGGGHQKWARRYRYSCDACQASGQAYDPKVQAQCGPPGGVSTASTLGFLRAGASAASFGERR